MATIANLSIAVTVNAGNSTAQLKTLTVQIQNFGNSFGTVSRGVIAQGALMANALEGVFNKAVSAVSGVISFFGSQISKAINLSAQFNNALIGLGDVGAAFGHNFDEVTRAARDLSKDGLL